jgi:hypothetical protein
MTNDRNDKLGQQMKKWHIKSGKVTFKNELGWKNCHENSR